MREAQDAHTGRLAPLARPGRWRARYGTKLGGLALLVAGALVVWRVVRRDALDCRRALRSEPPGVARSVCEAEYRETHDPATGVRLASLLRQQARFADARRLVGPLLDTPERANAYQVLGKIAFDEHHLDDAANALGLARALHRGELDRTGVATDDQALAGVQSARDQYADALASLDECLQLAGDDPAHQIEYYCRLSAAGVLAKVGDFALARRELARATALAGSDRQRAWLEYQQGNYEQDIERDPQSAGHEHRAVAAFEKAAELNARDEAPGLARTIEVNLAFSLAEVGRLDDAQRHLDIARMLDLDRDQEDQRAVIAARIAFHRGDLARAASLGEAVYHQLAAPDDRFEVAALLARIALTGGDLGRAEDWARRGIADVETMRAAQRVLELRSHVLSSRREPYELLFVALARAGRAEDSALVLDQWHGRAVLDALAGPSPRPATGLAGAAQRVARLGRWLPAVSEAPFGRATDRARLVDALRASDLLALVVAEREVWRVTASQGRLSIDDLGPVSALQDAVDGFAAAPTEPRLAGELGERLVPAAVFRVTPAPIHVLLDGAFAALPVVALRRGGRPLIAVRPVVRVLRLPDAPCIAAQAPARKTVLADAASDLPEARSEAEELARDGFTAEIGPAATSTALFQAAGSDVVQLAVHAEVDASGGALVLHDRSVSALEISAGKLGPPLVMLSVCGSASSDDVDLAGSLAAGFVAAGSARVVATLRPVSDAAARRITTRFYRAGGMTDPVRALARVQAELAASGDRDWPSFAVFGHDVCHTQ